MGYTLPLHRRGYERFNVDGSAALIADKKLEQPLILKDLSARGAGVVSNFPLKVNEKIEIIIKACFLLKTAVRRNANVVWCNKIDENLWQAGLDFGLDQLINLC